MSRIHKEKGIVSSVCGLRKLDLQFQCPYFTPYSKCIKDINERPETKMTPIENALKRVLSTFLGNFENMSTKRDIYKWDCTKPKNFAIAKKLRKPMRTWFSFCSVK